MWVRTDRANLITQSLQVDEFADLLATTVDDMTAHSYISIVQNKYLVNQKENLNSDTNIMLDFADINMFYKMKFISFRSFHWNNIQSSIHPAVIYFMSQMFLQEKSFGYISEDL